MGSLFDPDSWIRFSTTTPPPPYTQPMETSDYGSHSLEDSLRDCEYALEELEDTVVLLEGQKAEALAAQERAEQRAKFEKARATELKKKTLEAIERAKEAEKSSEESHSKMVAAELSAKAEKARVTELEQAIFASISKAKEAQKSSDEAHSKMVSDLAAEKARTTELSAKAELADQARRREEKLQKNLRSRDKKVDELEQALSTTIRKAEEARKSSKEAHSKMVSDLLAEARRREEKLQENLRSRDKKVDVLEQARKSSEEAHSKMVGELAEARRREEKLHEKIESRDKRADELVKGCAHLWECWQDTAREVVEVVSEKEGLMVEKEELKAKVEELSKALEEALARETSRLEEEYDKVEYEGLETWECCKLDDEESDSYPSS